MDRYEELKTIIQIYNNGDNYRLFELDYNEIVTSIFKLGGLIKECQSVSDEGYGRIIVYTHGQWDKGDLEVNYTLKDICSKFVKSENLDDFVSQVKENLFRRSI